jgi:hypothetical protein
VYSFSLPIHRHSLPKIKSFSEARNRDTKAENSITWVSWLRRRFWKEKRVRQRNAPSASEARVMKWGKLAERGGKNAKKRAVVAVARKLAILLHRLWVSGEVYEPLRNSQKAMRAVA